MPLEGENPLLGDHSFPHFSDSGREVGEERSGASAPVPMWVRVLIVVVPWTLLVVLYYFYTSEPDWDIAIRYPLLFFCFCMFVAAITATIVAVFMLGRSRDDYPTPPLSCLTSFPAASLFVIIWRRKT
jgi:hypothetical protein